MTHSTLVTPRHRHSGPVQCRQAQPTAASWPPVHILLTGPIGRALLPLLIERGHTVTAMTRRRDVATPLRAIGADPVVADAFDREALMLAVRRAGPDVLIHQMTDLRVGNRKAHAVLRAVGTRHVLDAGRRAGVRGTVAQSVAFAAYQAGEQPADERVPLDLGATDVARSWPS